ncbi:MAG: hypothetical protein LBU32_24600 [Clostridiales bacterium]|nr:hypothetical protein [Clostridiales bacterium]
MKIHSDAPSEEELRKRPGRRPVPPAPVQANPNEGLKLSNGFCYSVDLPPVSDVFIRIPALEPKRFSDPIALRRPPTHPLRPDPADSRPSADRIPFPQPGSRSGFTAALMDGIMFSAIFSYISAPAFSNACRNAP